MYSIDTFVVSSGNEEAYKIAMNIIAGVLKADNPFVFYGPLGVGKTHLLQAIRNAAENRNQKVFYFIGDEIEYFDVSRQIQMAELLLVDDIQNIHTERGWKNLAEIYRKSKIAKKNIVFSANQHPLNLKVSEPDMLQLISQSQIVKMELPDYETRKRILAKMIENEYREEVRIPASVIEYIAMIGGENTRILVGMLNKIVAMARIEHITDVDLGLAEKWLLEK